jgi:hypothetical protein
VVIDKRESGWWAWLKPLFATPVAAAMPVAAMLLLGVTLYQSVIVIPGLRGRLDSALQPRVTPSAVARAATRGDGAAIRVSPQDEFINVILDIHTTVPVSSYTVQVYDETGSLTFAVPAPAPARGESLHLLLPATELKPGRYTIKVLSQGPGSGSETSDEYSFALQR